jgi:hypothetical protein
MYQDVTKFRERNGTSQNMIREGYETDFDLGYLFIVASRIQNKMGFIKYKMITVGSTGGCFQKRKYAIYKMVQLSLCLTKHQAMKTYRGSGGMLL